MTRLIFIFTILLINSNTLLGTHNIAGEIQVQQLSHFQYVATINTYTKETSIAADRDSVEICWGDGLCEWIPRSTEVSLGADIKFNTYIAQHTYSSSGNYNISMTDPNRNAGILNVNPPQSDNVAFHIQTMIKVGAFNNNLPQFLNPPNEQGFVGVPLYHNLAAIDIDGDSLGYEFAIPLQAGGAPVPNYSFPHEFGSGTNTLTINQETGLITWDKPKIQGAYVLTLRVNEYRDGALLSSTLRDIQYIIGSIDSLVPPISSFSIDDFIVETGDSVNFDFTIYNSNSHTLKVSALGLPFNLNNPPSLDIPSGFTTDSINGSFSWEISAEHIFRRPHIITFRIDQKMENQIYTEYKFVKITTLGTPISTPYIKNDLSFKLFPNPVYNDNLFIELPQLSNQSLQINVFDNLGRLVLRQQTDSSIRTLPLNISMLQKGTYFIQIISEDSIGLQKFIVF